MGLLLLLLRNLPNLLINLWMLINAYLYLGEQIVEVLQLLDLRHATVAGGPYARWTATVVAEVGKNIGI